jgi:methionyl-tRNA synthetase
VDPIDIANELGVDPLRYFVLREYTFGGDGDFTYEALLQRYESDLGNDLGNLLNRTVSMARQYVGGVVPPLDAKDARLTETAELVQSRSAVWAEAAASWGSFDPSGALESAWSLARAANRHIEVTKPWTRAKRAKEGDPSAHAEIEEILATLCESLRRIAVMIAPAMPAAADAILGQLGLPPLWPLIDADKILPASPSKPRWRLAEPDSEENAWHWEPGTPFDEPKPLFPRLDPPRKTALLARWSGATEQAAAASAASTASTTASTTNPSPSPAASGDAPVSSTKGDVTIEDFGKIDLRAAKVLTAERVPKTDKLLKLTLDLGTEQRTVISGIAAAYAPEGLVGKTVIYLANLKPAKIRGVLSQGMILAAGDHDVLALSALDRDVPPGTIIR